jgi:hypothetical protein
MLLPSGEHTPLASTKHPTHSVVNSCTPHALARHHDVLRVRIRKQNICWHTALLLSSGDHTLLATTKHPTQIALLFL